MSNGNGSGFVRSLVDGDLEGFRQGFESFLDRCPFFLHHVNAGRFLPVFFFGMFATAHGANILNSNERVYFRFDNHGIDTRGRNRRTGNLKVVILTYNRDGQQVFRCYSISDRPNSDGLRFSTREGNALVREVMLQNPDLREDGLNFEQYKICMHGRGKSQGEAIATVCEAIREKDREGRGRFAGYSASETSLLRLIERRRLIRINAHVPRSVLTVREIGGMRLDQNQLDQLNGLVNFVQLAPVQPRIDNFIEMLASNQEQGVSDSLRGDILEYITNIYNNYREQIENNIENRYQKFESHAFLLGFLANFSHRCTIDIDLDLSPRNSHVAFLVRRQAERGNIPVVISLATHQVSSAIALDRARGRAQRLHASSFIPIHAESRHAVCVGLNFDLNLDRFNVGTEALQHDRFPLVQRLFDCVGNEGIRGNIRDFLLQHIPAEIPRNAANYNRIFDCITGFAFGSSAFDRHPLELEGGGEAPITKYVFTDGDENLRSLTMVFHAEGSDIVILHIRGHNAQQQGAVNLQDLNINVNDVHVREVLCILDNQLNLGIRVDDFGLHHDYQNDNANNFLDGDLVQVLNAENVHGISERVMNDGWQDRNQHQELFRNISGVLMPQQVEGTIIGVNSEDKFRSILHGALYASGGNHDKVITRYRVGQTYTPDIDVREGEVRRVRTRVTEQGLDLLLLRQPIESDLDTHPIGYVLRLAGNQGQVQQEQIIAGQKIKSLMEKQRGYTSLTPGNVVVLSYAVFDRNARGAEGLITIPRELYIHRLDHRGRVLWVGQTGRPEIVEGIGNLDERFRNFQENVNEGERQPSTFLYSRGDDEWIEVHVIRHFKGTKEEVLRRIGSGTRGSQDILHTLESETLRRNNYLYWIQQHDMVDIARVCYDFNVQGLFEVTSVEQIEGQAVRGREEHQWINERLQALRQDNEGMPLILIVNVGNIHWVTLVITYQNGNYFGYYADSSGGNIPHNIEGALGRVNIHNVLANRVGGILVQQKDGHNCGLWALENARDISQVLRGNNNHEEQGQGVLDGMRHLLTLNVPGLNNIVDGGDLRNDYYFQKLRVDISNQLRRDPQRVRNINQFGGVVHQGNEQNNGGSGGLVEAPILSNLHSAYSSQQQETSTQVANDDQPSSELREVQAPMSQGRESQRF